MNVVLIGGTVEALVLAHHLVREHRVHVIEIEAELGLPAMHPGRIIQPNILNEYMTEEQQAFLLMSQNEHGWGCRWDWLLKHLAANASRDGVVCMTRTRILSCSKHGDQYSIELSTSERDLPTHLIADRVYHMNQTPDSSPGLRKHTLVPSQPLSFPSPPSAVWDGGTVLTADAETAPRTDLRLSRGDGMTELWWKDELAWEPPRGFFERTTAVLPTDPNELCFDSIVSRVRAFLHEAV